MVQWFTSLLISALEGILQLNQYSLMLKLINELGLYRLWKRNRNTVVWILSACCCVSLCVAAVSLLLCGCCQFVAVCHCVWLLSVCCRVSLYVAHLTVFG
jgi:hypothetical protein